MERSIAWVLEVGLCVAFACYAAIDAKLDWIVFGNQYERNQQEIGGVIRELISQVKDTQQKVNRLEEAKPAN